MNWWAADKVEACMTCERKINIIFVGVMKHLTVRIYLMTKWKTPMIQDRYWKHLKRAFSNQILIGIITTSILEISGRVLVRQWLIWTSASERPSKGASSRKKRRKAVRLICCTMPQLTKRSISTFTNGRSLSMSRSWKWLNLMKEPAWSIRTMQLLLVVPTVLHHTTINNFCSCYSKV